MPYPYVLLSAAVSLDGYLDDTTPERLLLSSRADFDRVDEVRASVDAILIGAADDPRRQPPAPGELPGAARRPGGRRTAALPAQGHRQRLRRTRPGGELLAHGRREGRVHDGEGRRAGPGARHRGGRRRARPRTGLAPSPRTPPRCPRCTAPHGRGRRNRPHPAAPRGPRRRTPARPRPAVRGRPARAPAVRPGRLPGRTAPPGGDPAHRGRRPEPLRAHRTRQPACCPSRPTVTGWPSPAPSPPTARRRGPPSASAR